MSILAYPVWEYWIINRVQFPLRFLLLADLSLGLSAALLAKHVARTGFKNLARWQNLSVKAVGFTLVMAMTTTILQAQTAAQKTFSVPNQLDHTGPPEYISSAGFSANLQRFEDAVTPETTDEERYATFFNEMRRGRDLAKNAFQEAAPNGMISSIAGRGYVIELDLKRETDLLLPVSAWPYWQAQTTLGLPVEVSTDTEFGMAQIAAPSGQSKVYLTVSRTEPEVWGQRISVFALIALLLATSCHRLKLVLSLRRDAPPNG